MDESVPEYVAELRSLATYCNFGAYLTELLRDLLVGCMTNDAIQQRLLAEFGIHATKSIGYCPKNETCKEY